ncbi:tail fiber protein [Curvibacter phage P26059A]|nr:tail fiber protein [Curvibacter phage P26059A]
MADHNKPVLTSTYANFVSELDARFDDLSLGLDPAVTSATNLPVNAIRWNSALAKDQKWNGSSWVDKSSFYVLGSVRFNNGTVGAPSITFSDDTTTGIFKPTPTSIALTTSGVEALRATSGNIGIPGTLQLNSAVSIDANSSALTMRYAGGDQQYGISIKADADNTQAIGFFNAASQPVGRISQTATNIQIFGLSNLSVDNAVFSKDGFLTTNYVVNARNPIWRFGDSQLVGISYFQGTSGYQSADSIGMHFGEANAAGSKFSFTSDGRLVTTKNIVSGIAAPHDSGQNITVNGTGTTASTAPYLTVNSRGLVAGNGSQFTSGGLLFASYRDVRTTSYIGGITMRVRNVNDVVTDPVQMEFRIGPSYGDSFANAGDAALPAAPMTLSAGGVLNVSTSITTPYMQGVAAQSNGLKVSDPEETPGLNRELAHITPQSVVRNIRADFAQSTATGTGGRYAGVMTFSPYDGKTASAGGPSYQLAFGSSQNNGGSPQLRIRNGIDTTWNSWVDVMTPAGAIVHFARASAPSGYLKANGAAVSRTAYHALFDIIGTTFGAGDGSTTFNLPDLRAQFIRGWDDGLGVDSFRIFGSFQSGSVESHTHAPPAGLTGPWLSNAFSGDGQIDSSNVTGPGERNGVLGNTQAYGGDETRPRNIALLACIKY